MQTVRRLTEPTPPGDFFSVAVCSDGSYDVPAGIMFSFPVRSNGKDWEIVKHLELKDFARKKIDLTLKELWEEKKEVETLLMGL